MNKNALYPFALVSALLWYRLYSGIGFALVSANATLVAAGHASI
ncbi:hypothetical protein ACROAE_04125 [Shewanella sp. MF05960]